MNKKRFRIGYFAWVVHQKNQQDMLAGVIDAAQKHDVDIVRFAVELDYNFYRLNDQQKILCTIADDLELDGILYLGWIGNPQDIKKYFIKSKKIPIVVLGVNNKEFISVFQDGSMYIEELITHFIKRHQRKKIVYVEPVHPDSRIEVYKKKMMEYGCYDPDYIVLTSELALNDQWDMIERTKLIDQIIFEKRKLTPGAVMSMNADETVFLMERFKQRNLNIPGDVAFSSWEESELCRYNDPPITTVYYPFYETGYKGCDVLADLLEGKEVEKRNQVHSKIYFRESCGCVLSSLIKAVIPQTGKQYSSFNQMSKKERDDIIADLKTQLFILDAEQIFNIFKEALTRGTTDVFINWFDSAIRSRHLSIEQLHGIQDEFLLFRQKIKPYIIKNEQLNLLSEEIEIKIQIVINSWIEKTFGTAENNKALFLTRAQEIGLDLIATFDLDKIKELLYNNLPKIRIANCYIYRITMDNDATYSPSMIFGFQDHSPVLYIHKPKDDENCSTIIDPNVLFKTTSPQDLDNKNTDRRHTYLLHILHIRDKLLGCVFYEYGIEDDRIYMMLSVELSCAIEAALVLEELQKTNDELTDAHHAITNQMEIINERTSELELSNEKLSNLDNLKNDFIANITHDFRSPLMIILNNTDLGLKYDKLDEIIERRYKIIQEASFKLKTSIDRLLELARIDAQGIKIHVRIVPLKTFLEGITDFYRSAVMTTKIKIVYDFKIREVNIHTDPDVLEEVLNNLISNAMKFIDPQKGEIIIGLQELEETVRIHIIDNGIGIPVDKLDAIFGRFAQVESGRNSIYKGTGIGLAFSKQLVSYLKGEIWAESRGLETGAKFIVELKKGRDHFTKEELAGDSLFFLQEEQKRFEFKKIIESELKSRLDKNAVMKVFGDLNHENEFDPKKGIILVIDDNAQIRDIVFEYLSHNGYKNVILAGDGKQGIEAAFQYRPDMIICDYNMPNMRGDELQDKLSTNPDFKKIPFIFLTALTDKDVMVERKRKGAVAYLSKPVDEADLILTVQLNMNQFMELKATLYQATTDELTGINNKASLLRQIRQLFVTNNIKDVSFVFFDLDHFKLINDTYGHQTGDAVLFETGKMIRKALRKNDIAGRYGGEEFIIVMPGTNSSQAFFEAEKLRNLFKECIVVQNNQEIRFTASFGISSLSGNKNKICEELQITDLSSLFTKNIITDEEKAAVEIKKIEVSNTLISLADLALYISKRTSCKNCSFHSEKSEVFIDQTCPECAGTDIITGRDKSTVLPDSF